VRGTTFAFLGYNDIGTKQEGISWADETTIKNDIANARKNADVVVVMYHWGIEYRDQPDGRQKYLGHLTIDAGADLVIGNHPHWIQPIEFYKGKLITYAHGNFVFDQEWSLKTKQGVVGKYTFYDNSLVDVEYFPVLIENYGQPTFLTGDEKKMILDDMKKQSTILKSTPGN
jgi:poly-gamma-glutamate synthesis protein (capsule biosynthesis protein)